MNKLNQNNNVESLRRVHNNTIYKALRWAMVKPAEGERDRSRFQTWPALSQLFSVENWAWTLPSVCFPHMHNTAGGSLHRLVHNSNKSSILLKGKRWSSWVQQAEAGSDILIPLWRSHGFLDNKQTPVFSSCLKAPILILLQKSHVSLYSILTPKTIFTSSAVSSTYVDGNFPPEIFVFSFSAQFGICCMLNYQHTQTLSSSNGSPAEFSHWLIRTFSGHFTRGLRNSGWSPGPLRVQCRSESIYSTGSFPDWETHLGDLYLGVSNALRITCPRKPNMVEKVISIENRLLTSHFEYD